MELITVLLLLGPGIMMWKLSGDCDLSTREAIIRMVLKVIFNNFVVLILSYVALFIIYGHMTLNMSSEYVEGVGNSIFNIGFVWKYGLMSCTFAIGLAMMGKVCKKIKEKRSHK